MADKVEVYTYPQNLTMYLMGSWAQKLRVCYFLAAVCFHVLVGDELEQKTLVNKAKLLVYEDEK